MPAWSHTKKNKIWEITKKIQKLKSEHQQLTNSLGEDEEGLLLTVDNILYCGNGIGTFIRQIEKGNTYLEYEEAQDIKPEYIGENLRSLTSEWLRQIDASTAQIRQELEL